MCIYTVHLLVCVCVCVCVYVCVCVCGQTRKHYTHCIQQGFKSRGQHVYTVHLCMRVSLGVCTLKEQVGKHCIQVSTFTCVRTHVVCVCAFRHLLVGIHLMPMAIYQRHQLATTARTANSLFISECILRIAIYTVSHTLCSCQLLLYTCILSYMGA